MKTFWYVFCVDPKKIDETLKNIALREIPFIGKNRSKKLEYRCKTALDFKQLEYYEVADLMGKSGLKLWLELNGIDNMHFEKRGKQSGVSRTYSFHPNFTTDKDELRKHILRNFDRAFSFITENKLLTKRVYISLRRKDFQRDYGETVFPFHTNDKDLLLKNMKQLLNKIYQNDVYYRGTGVYFEDLKDISMFQYDLFNYKISEDKTKLYEIINQINGKYGRGTIRILGDVNAKKQGDGGMDFLLGEVG